MDAVVHVHKQVIDYYTLNTTMVICAEPKHHVTERQNEYRLSSKDLFRQASLHSGHI